MEPEDDYCGLIVDLGMSEGNDTEFYLEKGFRVIGVEADTAMVERLRIRFASALSCGQLKVLNFAASSSFAEPVEFFRHQLHQGVSGLEPHEHLRAGYTSHTVMTIDWKTILAQSGVPHYLKIDIEGQEAAFLSGMTSGIERPQYVSVECHTLTPAEALFDLGYRLFKLIDQNPPGGFRLPDPQTEGRTIEPPPWAHSSGPFGTELPDGDWLKFSEFYRVFADVQDQRSRTWFDCHAWMPSASGQRSPRLG